MVNPSGPTYPTTERRHRECADRFLWRGLGGLFVVIAVIGCVVLYSFGAIQRLFFIFYLSGYGIMSIAYYIAITIFALLNRRAVEQKVADIKASGDEESQWRPSVSLHVVGYREDPAYYRGCLESVKGLAYSNIRCIAIVVDGNDEEDMYMSEIAEEVFGASVTASIRLQHDPRATPEGYRHVYQRITANSASEATVPQVYIISQPHKGKREVIYTAYKISEFLDVDFFLNTDSDTLIDPEAVSEMVMMTKDRPNVGAVAGMLTIFNTTNWLSTLSASRYILAFNIERASQSYHGVVNCISGPLGLYRMRPVKEFIEGWVDQEFMGKKCTFGDDRHLTNLLLSTGRQVVYTHRASATTETPVEYTRFVAQQTRWSKSFWREMLLQSKWAYKHWYMVLEQIYNVVFPALIAVTILKVIFAREWASHLAIGIMTLVLPLIRSTIVYLSLRCSPLVFVSTFYPFLYFTTLLPVKFVALATTNNTSWGTSSRKTIVRNFAPVFPVIAWNLLLVAGLIWHILGRPTLL